MYLDGFRDTQRARWTVGQVATDVWRFALWRSHAKAQGITALAVLVLHGRPPAGGEIISYGFPCNIRCDDRPPRWNGVIPPRAIGNVRKAFDTSLESQRRSLVVGVWRSSHGR
jgi:hypothetical protein